MGETLEETLNACGWYHSGNPSDPRPDDPALLTTLVAHASPKKRRQVLAMLQAWQIEDLVDATATPKGGANADS